MARGGVLRLAIGLLTAAGLAGCFGAAPPVPRDHYYRVLVAPPAVDPAAPPAFPGVVSVAPFEADGLLRERPLLYSESGDSHEMQQHDYHYWTDPPPSMLQGQLVDYLRAGHFARAVVTPELRVAPDYTVTGRIKRFERLLAGGPPRVAAELELAMTENDDHRLVVVQTYADEEPAADDGVESSVLALNTALGRIFARFLDDAARSETARNPAPQ